MIELNVNDYYRVEPFFIGRKQYIPAMSVIHGNFPGRVFVDQLDEPKLVCVWATSRWMYMEGRVTNEKDKEKINQFILDIVVPDCKQRNANWFEIYSSDEGDWDELFLHGINSITAEKHYESVYILNCDKFKSKLYASRDPLDTIINLNEYAILPKEYHDLPYIEEVYKSKTCLGVELQAGNEVVSICRNNGFVLKGEYFIDIDTFDEEQRYKGYATTAAIRLIDHLLKKGMSPLWETTHQNTPSHKLALKLGFEVDESYPVYAFMFN